MPVIFTGSCQCSECAFITSFHNFDKNFLAYLASKILFKCMCSLQGQNSFKAEGDVRGGYTREKRIFYIFIYMKFKVFFMLLSYSLLQVFLLDDRLTSALSAQDAAILATNILKTKCHPSTSLRPLIGS